jgi:2-hydroxy-3-keto-5-methylthiopentenyl-1-phosphate phosphatase
VLPVGAVLVDFDGTACLHDVAEHLLMAFGEDSWLTFDEAVAGGEIGTRDAISAQAAMVRGTTEDLVAYSVAHCPMDPTFAPFARWLRTAGVPVALVSDGFGFYIEPILRAAGIDGITVITNRWDKRGDLPARMSYVSGHPECVGCGTCKMQAVLRYQDQHGLVAFVGEGASDRYGALYADIVFAKDVLPSYCRADGVPFLEWTDFDDVRRALEDAAELPGPVAPLRCPGWRLPA